MKPADLIVLGVGVATICAMLAAAALQRRAARAIHEAVLQQAAAAHRQAQAAEAQYNAAKRQGELAEAQMERELAAEVVVVRTSTDRGEHEVDHCVRIYNGGRHPALTCELWFEDDAATLSTPRVPVPIVAPGDAEDAVIRVDRAWLNATDLAMHLRIRWVDGRGTQEVRLEIEAERDKSRGA